MYRMFFFWLLATMDSTAQLMNCLCNGGSKPKCFYSNCSLACSIKIKETYYKLFKRRVNKRDRIVFGSLKLCSKHLSGALYITDNSSLSVNVRNEVCSNLCCAIGRVREVMFNHVRQILKNFQLSQIILCGHERTNCQDTQVHCWITNHHLFTSTLDHSDVPDWIKYSRGTNLLTKQQRRQERVTDLYKLSIRDVCSRIYQLWEATCENKDTMLKILHEVLCAVFCVERGIRDRALYCKHPKNLAKLLCAESLPLQSHK